MMVERHLSGCARRCVGGLGDTVNMGLDIYLSSNSPRSSPAYVNNPWATRLCASAASAPAASSRSLTFSSVAKLLTRMRTGDNRRRLRNARRRGFPVSPLGCGPRAGSRTPRPRGLSVVRAWRMAMGGGRIDVRGAACVDDVDVDDVCTVHASIELRTRVHHTMVPYCSPSSSSSFCSRSRRRLERAKYSN